MRGRREGLSEKVSANLCSVTLINKAEACVCLCVCVYVCVRETTSTSRVENLSGLTDFTAFKKMCV